MELNVNSNNINEQIKVTEYADTAYKGKADPYYRENIAGPEQRKRHLAKGQCQMGVFPRVKITGSCWDVNQALPDKDEFNGDSIYKKLDIKENELRLPLDSLSQNIKESLFRFWLLLHVVVIGSLVVYLLIGLILGGWSDLMANLDVLIIGSGVILISKYSLRLFAKLGLVPTGQYVIFNRQTGMIEIANEQRTEYLHLPFEQFNAHHRKVHNERGHPSYGFTLLHFQQDLMYQVADNVSVEDALVHWELIKNFMDTSQPLADIPQFEHYRKYDPTTIAFDKKHGRPKDFWCRVDEKFFNKVAKLASRAFYKFPINKANTLHEAIQHGYKVPDIIKFPWKEADNISEEHLIIKPSWFVHYILRPLFP